MSDSELDYMRALVRGEKPLVTGDPPHLETVAVMYFQIAILNDQARPRLQAEIGDEFSDLARERLKEVIPATIRKLESRWLLSAIENDLTLIVRGCELFGLEVDDFIPRKELLPLARRAYIRSAAAFKQEYGMSQPSQLFFACAASMGITPEELGLEPEFVEQCIDSQLHRNHPDPVLSMAWTYHQENRQYLEQALQSH